VAAAGIPPRPPVIPAIKDLLPRKREIGARKTGWQQGAGRLRPPTTPGALYRYWRRHQAGGRLALVLIAGTLPGVIAGSIIGVELLPGPRVFELVVAAALLPLGLWLTLTRPTGTSKPGRPVRAIPDPVLVLLAVAVGGIGGGSILAPILIGAGRSPAQAAPAALASTFVTSVAGVVTFTIWSIHQHGPVAPAWPTGIVLEVGGLAGAYSGARIQPACRTP